MKEYREKALVIHVYMYIYTCTYMYVHVYVYVYVYVHVLQRCKLLHVQGNERDIERERVGRIKGSKSFRSHAVYII